MRTGGSLSIREQARASRLRPAGRKRRVGPSFLPWASNVRAIRERKAYLGGQACVGAYGPDSEGLLTMWAVAVGVHNTAEHGPVPRMRGNWTIANAGAIRSRQAGRRHHRLDRHVDETSSNLFFECLTVPFRVRVRLLPGDRSFPTHSSVRDRSVDPLGDSSTARSEERRVGKGCRARW